MLHFDTDGELIFHHHAQTLEHLYETEVSLLR